MVAALVAVVASPAAAQTRRRPAAKPVAPKTEAAVIECPSMLGVGVKTKLTFCDVLTGRDPAGGILVKIPPHTGDVTLTFDLHNRHTYSEELIKTNRAYRRYTATIGVMYMDVTLIERATVQSEFRSAADLVDRIEGGAGAAGVKAVAPTGSEPISMLITDDGTEMVSILGEKLNVIRPDGGPDNFTAPGRPIAVVSNVQLTYRPKPASRPPAKKPAPKKPAAKPRAAQ
jgi:hypothetical protein